jgi:chlorophyll synthase
VREFGLAGLVLGFAYSVPPVRLKAKPVADMLANGLGFGLLGFALGWLALLPYSSAMLLRSVPYTLAMCAIFLNTTIPDEAGDRSAGDRTSCVVLGRVAVARAALLALAASAAAAVLTREVPCAMAAAASLPAFIAVAVEPSDAVSVLASQFAGRALFVVVSVMVPQLAVLGALAYGISKLYYARRLGLDYPRLRGASARVRKSLQSEEGCRSIPPRSGP